MKLLELHDICFTATGREILAGLTLGIEAGEVHALLGTNGTGKNTLACVIMGCHGYHPVSGEIYFAGKPINNLKVHERARLGISMAWQEPARFEGLLIRDYLTLGAACEVAEAAGTRRSSPSRTAPGGKPRHRLRCGGGRGWRGRIDGAGFRARQR